MMGRTIAVPRAANGVAWFSFEDLCDADIASADYAAVCGAFHTVFVSSMPQLSSEVSHFFS